MEEVEDDDGCIYGKHIYTERRFTYGSYMPDIITTFLLESNVLCAYVQMSNTAYVIFLSAGADTITRWRHVPSHNYISLTHVPITPLPIV